MAWITTDTDIASTLTVSKKVNEQFLPGYPKTYSILQAFGEFAAITVDEWHKMLLHPRNERILAFIEYVNSVENINVRDSEINKEYQPTTGTPGQIVEV